MPIGRVTYTNISKDGEAIFFVVLAVFVDFRRASETENKDQRKLAKMGIYGDVLNRSCLCNRPQNVIRCKTGVVELWHILKFLWHLRNLPCLINNLGFEIRCNVTDPRVL